MSMFGDPRFMPFILGEQEGYQLVQAACVPFRFGVRLTHDQAECRTCSYERGIQTFDTANVRLALW